MPYFITQESAECAGWATVKEDGEVMGCHESKQAAIDQMVALSIAEDIEPGGERALPDNYRLALEDDVPEGRACGNCVFYNEEKREDDSAWCERWEDWVRGDHYCNAWQGEERDDDDEEEEDPYAEKRDVDLTVPRYIRAAARRGLDLRADGEGGAGLVERTIREARLMANGEISADKVVRAAAWAARHMVDLDAPKNSDADDDEWPGAGAVAFYLWGIDPLDPDPAIAWFERKRDEIAEEEENRDRSWYEGIAVRDRPGATLFRMSNGVETRRVTVNEFEVRDGEAGTGMNFRGYAAVFNSPSQPLPFIETIAPGAFSRSLQSRNEIKLFVNHDTSRVLASKRAGTMQLREDSYGLLVEAELPDTTDGRDMATLIKRGDVDSMSFGFSVPTGGDSWSDDGQRRELREVRLHETSLITGWPAYESTSTSVRSLDGLVDATGIEAEQLNAAISALEAGETLDDELAGVLDAAVTKLRADRDDVKAALAMKQKQLDMLLARV
jgi:HK97 family phage prohead protease